MPNITPAELIVMLSGNSYLTYGKDRCFYAKEPLLNRLFEKFTPEELLECIVRQECYMETSMRQATKCYSFFEAIIQWYGAQSREIAKNDGTRSLIELGSLKLFFQKLQQALCSRAVTEEHTQAFTDFLLTLMTLPAETNTITMIGYLAKRSSDLDLFKKFIQVVGVNTLEAMAIHPEHSILENEFVLPYILASVSSDTHREILLTESVRKRLVCSRINILTVLSFYANNSEIYHSLLQQQDFFEAALQYLYLEEFHLFILEKMDNRRLTQAMSVVIMTLLQSVAMHDQEDNLENYITVTYRLRSHSLWLLFSNGKYENYFTQLLYRLFPFALSQTLLPLLNIMLYEPSSSHMFFADREYYVEEYTRLNSVEKAQLKKHHLKCTKLISYINEPEKAIKNEEEKKDFLRFLNFHLNSKTQMMLMEPQKWLDVVTRAISACPASDDATRITLNEFHRMLRHRPELAKACASDNPATETWIELRSLARAQSKKADVSSSTAYRSSF